MEAMSLRGRTERRPDYLPSADAPTPIVLVDSSRLFREGLKRVLADSPFEIVGELDGLAQALNAEGVPEGAMFVVRLHGSERELERLGELREAHSGARIVVLADTGLDQRWGYEAHRAGADGYLRTDVSPQVFTQLLGLVLLDEKVFPTSTAGILFGSREEAPRPELRGGPNGLSERETQILRLLANGDPNKVIANRLGITEATVKVHLRTILKKINATNRTQAAIWAVNRGLAQSDEG